MLLVFKKVILHIISTIVAPKSKFILQEKKTLILFLIEFSYF